MAFTGKDQVWMNGKLVAWKDATVHVATHALHYGTGIFEGIRAYETKHGSAVYRLPEHMRRLYDSARIYRMDYDLDRDAMTDAVVETVSTLIEIPGSDEQRVILANALLGMAEAVGRRALQESQSGVDGDTLAQWIAEFAWFGLRGVRTN